MGIVKDNILGSKLMFIRESEKEPGSNMVLFVYDDNAKLLNWTGQAVAVVAYDPDHVKWDVLFDNNGMIIEEILLGFSLSDYFGENYHVCFK